MSQNLLELIEVQHCHEIVRLKMCRISTQKHFFERYMPLLKLLKISTLFDKGENNKVYNIIKL